MVEATGLKNVAWRSTSTASTAYQISSKATDRFKRYLGEHRQTGWRSYKPALIFKGKLAKK
jgi:hypothetical protein